MQWLVTDLGTNFRTEAHGTRTRHDRLACLPVPAAEGVRALRAGLRARQGKRYALPNTRIMLHHPSGSARGQASDIHNEARELMRLRNYVNQVLSSATGQSVDKARRSVCAGLRAAAPHIVLASVKLWISLWCKDDHHSLNLAVQCHVASRSRDPCAPRGQDAHLVLV